MDPIRRLKLFRKVKSSRMWLVAKIHTFCSNPCPKTDRSDVPLPHAKENDDRK